MNTRTAILRCLGLAALTALSSCTLYFGESDGYWSDDDSCWDSDCNDGYYCEVDTQCAAGCYCGDYGYCEEAGYCTTDADCGPGFLCDEARNSCDPDGGSNSCNYDGDCLQGSYCDEGTGECVESTYCWEDYDCGEGFSCVDDTCVPDETCATDDECAAGCYCDPSAEFTTYGCAESCYCSTDAEATDAGWGYCDEDRGTCMPGTDPDRGSCAGEITCAFGAPTCDAGAVPLIKDGCWTGECSAVAECDAAPSCEVLNTEDLCIERSDCFPVYNGINCTNGNGAACQAGEGGCVCEDYRFDECRTDAVN